MMASAAVATALVAVSGPAVLAETRTVAAGGSQLVHTVQVAELDVLYNGQRLSSAEASELSQEAEASQREFVLVYDPASSRAGLAHAFDTAAEADAFGAANATAMKLAGSKQASSGARTFGPLPTTCAATSHQSKMYDGANCTGGYTSLFRVDNVPNFGTYGWNNKGSSIVVGGSDCQILVRLYPGVNYTYVEARFYGSGTTASEYYVFNSAQTNNFESGKSTCS